MDELFFDAVVVAAVVEEVFNKQLLLKAVVVADADKELFDKQLLLAVDVVTAVDEEFFNEPLCKNEVAFDKEGITVHEVVAVEKASVLSSESSSSDPEVKIL
jgi:microcompartment protein CcmK/EutM